VSELSSGSHHGVWLFVMSTVLGRIINTSLFTSPISQEDFPGLNPAYGNLSGGE
jgi:hypothetical protein